MANTRFALTFVLAANLCAACSGSPGGNGSQQNSQLIPACTWPAAADTLNVAFGTGCSPKSMFDICQVPNGSIVHADGSITTPDGGIVSCSDYCLPTEYALNCYGAATGTVPTPDLSLNCRAIAIPTPSNALFYCCPCAQQGG